MKKLLLVVKDVDIIITHPYNELLQLVKEEDDNIDQILIDIKEKVIYCYGLPTVKTLLA